MGYLDQTESVDMKHSNPVPEPWASAMVDVGITDPRNATRASWQEMSRRTGIHVTTLSKMGAGKVNTRQYVVDRVADQLKVPPEVVNAWVGRVRSVRRPFETPPEANLLSEEEQQVVTRLIVLLAESKKRGGGRDAGSASSTQAGGSLADRDLRAAP